MTAGLLLVAHGSRHRDCVPEMERLRSLVAARVDAVVGVGWLDHATPSARESGLEMLATLAAPVVVVPALLFHAFHARQDIPDLLAQLEASDPRRDVRLARHLGLDPRLADRAAAAVGRANRGSSTEGLLVVSTGSSDPDAQAEAATAARMVAERTGHARVRHAFASLAAPDPATSVEAFVEDGADHLVVFSWTLLAGRLAERAAEGVEQSAASHGVAVRHAGRLGPDPAVADVIATRYAEALRR